jgi:trehalose synthase
VTHLHQVPVKVGAPERFEAVLPPELYDLFADGARRARSLFEGRVVWNVNSTAKGGGVAEMLRSLLPYARGAGVDARWLVLEGDPDFFHVTKRMHNNLHGFPGDGGDLGDDARATYERTLFANRDELEELVGPDDVVLLHDPQTAGLAPMLAPRGCAVVWRCHIGTDAPNDLVRRAWSFLTPYVSAADACVFSRRAFAWDGLDPARTQVIHPSIDAFSPKNQDMDPATARAILRATRIIDEDGSEPATFVREDGTPGRVDRHTELFDGGAPPSAGVPLVVQVSRWDRLKDPLGVAAAFVRHVAPHSDAHLVLAGPAVEAVSDDPEGAEVLEEVRAWQTTLEPGAAARVHLALLPMEDGEENAAIVNALQRRADVVVQKSLAEGFGLTVAEAMWKARPVVATRVGGIQDQIVHERSGLLVDDPRDLAALGAAVTRLLGDPDGAAELGGAARARVRHDFLGPRHLLQYLGLLGELIGATPD